MSAVQTALWPGVPLARSRRRLSGDAVHEAGHVVALACRGEAVARAELDPVDAPDAAGLVQRAGPGAADPFTALVWPLAGPVAERRRRREGWGRSWLRALAAEPRWEHDLAAARAAAEAFAEARVRLSRCGVGGWLDLVTHAQRRGPDGLAAWLDGGAEVEALLVRPLGRSDLDLDDLIERAAREADALLAGAWDAVLEVAEDLDRRRALDAAALASHPALVALGGAS